MHDFSATVPAWMSQMSTLPGPCTGARGSILCDGVELGRQIYGEREQTQFTAFAYLWRRFGPPWCGSDPQKDLVGYILGTPHPEVFLTLGLSASPLPYAIGYLITRTLSKACSAPRVTAGRAPTVVEDALTTALVELLRPVFIRDVAVNILGRVADAQLDDRETAAASVYAGYGIPQDAMAALLHEEGEDDD